MPSMFQVKGTATFSKTRFVVDGIYIGFMLSLILSLGDFYVGKAFAELSWRTLLSFLIVYSGTIVPLSFFISLLLAFRTKRENGFYRNLLLLTIVLFLTDFVYASLKLNGWFNLLNFRAVVVNILLIIGLSGFFYLASKYKGFRKGLTSAGGLLAAAILIFGFTAYYNFLLLNFSTPPSAKFKVIYLLLGLIAIPYISVMIVNVVTSILHKYIYEKRINGVVPVVVSLLIVLAVPGIFKGPNMSAYLSEARKSDAEKERGSIKPLNVIFIVLDTARRDVFSCYGYHRQTTPNIDKLAQEGVLFNNYISTAPWTLPAHASMFTGLYSSQHGATHSSTSLVPYKLEREFVTLAELLSQYGMNTAGIVANFGMVNRAHNFEQGFGFFYDGYSFFYNTFWGMLSKKIATLNFLTKTPFFRINKYSLSSEINEIAFHWLEKNKADPFFLFINYMEPHDGIFYLPPPYDTQFDFSWSKWPRIDRMEIYEKKKEIDSDKQQVLFDWYDCKISFMDYQIGSLFDRLKQLDLYDNSLIIVVSDHGELFGEHFSFGHETELYNELIWVPLIIKYPKEMGKIGVVEKYVQTVDLMPEILSLLQIPVPPDVQGEPLEKVSHEIISELFKEKDAWTRYDRDLRAIYSKDEDDLKYIQASNGESELYDLKNDPYELNNIVDQFEKKAAILEARIENWHLSIKTPVKRSKPKKQMKKEMIERLKALGYIK